MYGKIVLKQLLARSPADVQMFEQLQRRSLGLEDSHFQFMA